MPAICLSMSPGSARPRRQPPPTPEAVIASHSTAGGSADNAFQEGQGFGAVLSDIGAVGLDTDPVSVVYFS